ncbi:MAG: metal-dependent transcriptional regulator [Clostridia bacterium]|nr:metal-dependent transcriptional regulator [Clostridia bacterium]
MSKEFHTLKGYDILEGKSVTYAMEDYLEMICRLAGDSGVVRSSELSEKLNVKPSSVTKMANNLKNAGLVQFERYGYIRPTEKGILTGEYLIHRHNVIERLLCMINGSDDELEQVEKIEHYLNAETIENIEKFLRGRDS